MAIGMLASAFGDLACVVAKALAMAVACQPWPCPRQRQQVRVPSGWPGKKVCHGTKPQAMSPNRRPWQSLQAMARGHGGPSAYGQKKVSMGIGYRVWGVRYWVVGIGYRVLDIFILSNTLDARWVGGLPRHAQRMHTIYPKTLPNHC